jgi:hypothetical protein
MNNPEENPMSDYIPRDPLGPNDPRGYDRYGNTRFEPVDDTGKGPYILLGLLVAIGLIGGLLYFNGSPKNESVAQAPAIERTAPTPAPAPSAVPAKPAAPATQAAPAPAAPAETPKQ